MSHNTEGAQHLHIHQLCMHVDQEHADNSTAGRDISGQPNSLGGLLSRVL